MKDSTVTFGGGMWASGQIAMEVSVLTNTGMFGVASADGMSRDPSDTSLFNNSATGTINFLCNDTSWFSVPFATWGTVNVNGQTVRFAQDFNQYGGTVDLGNGTFDMLGNAATPMNAYYNLLGGTLIAEGTIKNTRALWVDGGTLHLTGTLALTGDLRVNAGGTILIDIGSGVANVTGTVTLFGDLTPNVDPMFPPAQGVKCGPPQEWWTPR